MPRSLWNGTIAFGMVRVPVKLYSATESKAIRFRERHSTDGAGIEHRRMCVQEGREVPYGETVKGFEVSSGSYVTLTKEEVATADGPGAHMIEIEHFAKREEIDPVYYERAYRLGPGKLGDDSYRLLHAALKRSDRVGIGRFVFHNKAHLLALRAVEDVIALHTMRFEDELVASEELDLPEPQREPSKLEVSAARALVEQLSATFEPDAYEDTYREALLELIERKARGEAIAAPEPEPARVDGDLLAALQASLAQKKGRSSPAPKKGARATSAKKAAGSSRAPAKKPARAPSKGSAGASRSSAAGTRRTSKAASKPSGSTR